MNRIAQGIVPSMDFGWLIRVRARRRDSEAIIYVVASALARPARLRSFCLSGRSVEHELSDGLSRHFSFPCWHPVAGPAGAFRIERIAIVPAPGLLRRTTVPAGTRRVSMQSISILADNKLAEKAGWVLPFSA